MKSYTDIEQSKRLAEILPKETADFHFRYSSILEGWCDIPHYRTASHIKDLPCWSLAALLDVLPEYNLQRTDWGHKTEYKIVVTINDEDNYASKNYDNPLDACVDMIIKLKEKNLI